jgi:PHP family Zn ribbon phosphoesterase
MARPLEEMEHAREPSHPVHRRLRLVVDAETDERLPSYQMRTCAKCGARTWFRLEPQGVWYGCTACGKYA